MNYAVADSNFTTSPSWWPATPPTYTKAGITLRCESGMPRADFIDGAWMIRSIFEGELYRNAAYEVVMLSVGNEPITSIMVRRVAQGILGGPCAPSPENLP